MKALGMGGGYSPSITSGAAHVADVGIPSQRHNRYLTSTHYADAHPGDETKNHVTWSQTEDVRRYRVFPVGTAGDLLKCVEDAPSGAVANIWLGLASNMSSDSEPLLFVANQWSEWKEMSKDTTDISLGRLDFELHSGTGVTAIFVEAE